MNKLILITTTFVLCLVFIVPGILATNIKMVPYSQQPGYDVDHRRSIYFTNLVMQSFTAEEDRLTAIATTIGNPNMRNKKDVVLKLYEGKDLVRTSIVNGQNIPDGSFVKFVFEPIFDSKGKDYTFALASPDAREEDVIYVYISPNAPDWIGDTIFEDNKVFTEGKLPMVTYHLPKNKLSLILQLYKSWISKMIGK